MAARDLSEVGGDVVLLFLMTDRVRGRRHTLSEVKEEAKMEVVPNSEEVK